MGTGCLFSLFLLLSCFIFRLSFFIFLFIDFLSSSELELESEVVDEEKEDDDELLGDLRRCFLFFFFDFLDFFCLEEGGGALAEVSGISESAAEDPGISVNAAEVPVISVSAAEGPVISESAAEGPGVSESAAEGPGVSESAAEVLIEAILLASRDFSSARISLNVLLPAASPLITFDIIRLVALSVASVGDM